MPMTDTATHAKKIQRQPMFCATRPPKSAAKPEPPHDPIHHKLTARWRPAPSQYAFTSARLAGMMQAPDSPWHIRPRSRDVDPSGPGGDTPTSSEPTMLRPNPYYTVPTPP